MPIELPVSAGKYLRAGDFVEPQVLKVTKAPEYIAAEQYGDDMGMSYFYYFEDMEGNEKQLQNNSARLAKAFNEAELEVGDKAQIQKSGDGFQTQYTVTKVTPAG